MLISIHRRCILFQCLLMVIGIHCDMRGLMIPYLMLQMLLIIVSIIALLGITVAFFFYQVYYLLPSCTSNLSNNTLKSGRPRKYVPMTLHQTTEVLHSHKYAPLSARVVIWEGLCQIRFEIDLTYLP